MRMNWNERLATASTTFSGNAQHRRGGRAVLAVLALAAAALAAPVRANAALIIEPVFNRVAGSGGDTTIVPLYNPGFLNGATGLPFLLADEPGEIDTYPAGFPPDPVLVDTVRFYNNTQFNITGFTLSLIGTAVEPEPFNFIVTRGPVDAIWGDANGDGSVGSSDIFGSITLSPDMKTIFFSGGVIPVGGRFTDFHYAAVTAGESAFLAGIDASFTGTAVPEPATLMLVSAGGVLAALRRRRPADGPGASV